MEGVRSYRTARREGINIMEISYIVVGINPRLRPALRGLFCSFRNGTVTGHDIRGIISNIISGSKSVIYPD